MEVLSEMTKFCTLYIELWNRQLHGFTTKSFNWCGCNHFWLDCFGNLQFDSFLLHDFITFTVLFFLFNDKKGCKSKLIYVYLEHVTETNK
jgi:hypothetical protein